MRRYLHTALSALEVDEWVNPYAWDVPWYEVRFREVLALRLAFRTAAQNVVSTLLTSAMVKVAANDFVRKLITSSLS